MAATRRRLLIVDIAELEQVTPQVLAADAHLFAPPVAWQYADAPFEGQSTGQQTFAAASPPYGATITYRLATRQAQMRLAILDATGDTIQTLNGPGAPGVNRVAWGFQGKAVPRPVLSAAQRRDSSLQMQRITHVLDSLQTAGTNPMALGMVRQLATTGDLTPLMMMFGGGGGTPVGFGGSPAFNPRPGEQVTAPGGRGAGAGRGGAAGPGGAAGAAGGGAMDQSVFMNLIGLFRIPGRGAVRVLALISWAPGPTRAWRSWRTAARSPRETTSSR